MKAVINDVEYEAVWKDESTILIYLDYICLGEYKVVNGDVLDEDSFKGNSIKIGVLV